MTDDASVERARRRQIMDANTWRARFWSTVLHLLPNGPIWRIAFTYYDDAIRCGCWRESVKHRWSKGRRR